MEQLPVYISIVFIITTLLALFLLLKAAGYTKPVISVTSLWLALQGLISLLGFYKVTTAVPPRFALLLVPPVLFIILLFCLKNTKKAIAGFDAKTLTLFHIVRIPVELILFALCLHKGVPRIMTFEGRNFDILCGLTAPFIYYFGYIKNMLGKKVLLAWNLACLLLLANIVVIAVLSAPFAFQRFAFNQPNIALFYFPFVWLPGFIVPAALFAHLVTIKHLIND